MQFTTNITLDNGHTYTISKEVADTIIKMGGAIESLERENKSLKAALEHSQKDMAGTMKCVEDLKKQVESKNALIQTLQGKLWHISKYIGNPYSPEPQSKGPKGEDQVDQILKAIFG